MIEIASDSKITSSNICIKGNNNKLIIHKGTMLRGVTIEIIGDNCRLEIGNYSMIGNNSYLSVKESTSLLIGNNCGLSRNIKILTSDGHPIYIDNKRINNAKDIVLQDNIWIADNVTILKGVTIGKGSVIGINSTVVKEIPESSIAVGNPAKVVKNNILWKDKY